MKALFGAAEQRAFLPSTIVTERSASSLTHSEVVSDCKSKRSTIKVSVFVKGHGHSL